VGGGGDLDVFVRDSCTSFPGSLASFHTSDSVLSPSVGKLAAVSEQPALQQLRV